MNVNQLRSKWAALGAAVAVSLGAGGIGITHATTSSGEKPVYLPIEPCRLADTRPDFQVGARGTPLAADETYTLDGQGSIGNCTLPTGTTALSLNVTALDASAPTFVSLFPAGASLPVASHLNPLPGQGPTPNAVNVDLSAGGEFSIYNLAGTVNVIIDVVGVFDDHNHDDRYYQKSESDAMYLAKSQDGEADVDGTDEDNAVNGTDEVMATVTVDIPTSGYVIANSSATLDSNGVASAAECSITTGTTVDTAALQQAYGTAEILRSTLAGTRGFTINKAFPFGSDEMTLNLVCQGIGGSPSLLDPQLTAVFVPDPDAFGFGVLTP